MKIIVTMDKDSFKKAWYSLVVNEMKAQKNC